MEKSFFEQMGGTYRQEGDYLIPNLVLPESAPVGIWGQRRRKYLREHRNPIYTDLLLDVKLDTHLIEIDQHADKIFSQLVKQMAQQEGLTEQLKTENQMEWVGQMNSIRNQVEEIIYNELIFA